MLLLLSQFVDSMRWDDLEVGLEGVGFGTKGEGGTNCLNDSISNDSDHNYILSVR